MRELLEAIQERFNATPTLADAFAEGLEVGLAKNAEALPLCVLTPIAQPAPDYSTQGAEGIPFVETSIVQVTIYSTDGTQVQDLAEAFDDAFDHKPMTLTAATLLDARRVSGGLPYADDENVTRVDLVYRFQVQRFLEGEGT